MSEVNVSETGDAPSVPESAENKIEAVAENQSETTEVANDVKSEEVKKDDDTASKDTKSKATSETVANESGDRPNRELEIIQKIEDLQKVKNDINEEALKLQLKMREQEVDLLKARVKNLETELQAALSKPGTKNQEMVDNIKQQHEELLAKARGMIFDKTKMVKNQELQIEALVTQVQSLKDINQITKDLLEIRNNEVKAMEERYAALETRMKVEKDKYGLLIQRAQTNCTINDDVKKEYETQMELFKELRKGYDQRVQALVAENERLKTAIQQNSAAQERP